MVDGFRRSRSTNFAVLGVKDMSFSVREYVEFWLAVGVVLAPIAAVFFALSSL